MTTITTPGSDEAVALLLEGAARELQFNGLTSGGMKRPDGSVCLYGALAQAAGVKLQPLAKGADVRAPDWFVDAGWCIAYSGGSDTHRRSARLLQDAGYTYGWSDTTARNNYGDPVDHIHALKTAAEAMRAGEPIPPAAPVR